VLVGDRKGIWTAKNSMSVILKGSPLKAFDGPGLTWTNLQKKQALSFLTAIFPGGTRLSGTRMSPFRILWELRMMGGGGDKWSCNTCKAPVISSPPAKQRPTFYRPDEKNRLVRQKLSRVVL